MSVVHVADFLQATGATRQDISYWKRSGRISNPGHGLVDYIEAGRVHSEILSWRARIAKNRAMAEARKARLPEWYDVNAMCRIMSWVVIDKDTRCWNYTRSQSKAGYCHAGTNKFGTIQDGYAHRFAYKFFNGPIPNGLSIDHLCKNRRCCNPDHLEVVTLAVNALRGEGPMARNARKTHCKHGHEFTEANTIVCSRRGRQTRHCATCKRQYDERRRKENPELMRKYVRDHYRRKRAKAIHDHNGKG